MRSFIHVIVLERCIQATVKNNYLKNIIALNQ